MKKLLGVVFVLHGTQALVCEPLVEYVLDAQGAITASEDSVQSDMTRWPGPAIVQSGHVLVCVPATEYVPLEQAAITALDVDVQAVVTRCPAPATEQAVQVAVVPVPCKEKLLAGHGEQLPEAARAHVPAEH